MLKGIWADVPLDDRDKPVLSAVVLPKMDFVHLPGDSPDGRSVHP